MKTVFWIIVDKICIKITVEEHTAILKSVPVSEIAHTCKPSTQRAEVGGARGAESREQTHNTEIRIDGLSSRETLLKGKRKD